MNPSQTDLRERELPRFIRDLLSSPPAAGTGLHPWLFKVTCALKAWRSDDEIATLLSTATMGCGRNLSREIAEAIRNAKNEWQPGQSPLLSAPPRPSWPKRDLAAIVEIANQGTGLADLWEASPIRLEKDGPEAEELIDSLFHHDSLLCLGTCPQDVLTQPRSHWRGKLGEMSLMVPSPMSALTGAAKDGHPSPRCLDNTGPRRFLVIEFDFKAVDSQGNPTPEAPLLAKLARSGRTVIDLCAALHLHLAQFAPLVLGVHSGGKSMHGWYPAAGIPPGTLSPFFRLAVRLGADPATWTPCQLIRIPEGLRDNGKRQRLWFYNPAAIPTL